MSNHYHLFIETPEANLVVGMAWLQNTVTRRYNVPYQHTVEGRSYGLVQAERWMKEWLELCGLSEGALRVLKNGDRRKKALALLLWKHTAVSQRWIAERLAMKSAANVSQQLRQTDVVELVKSLPPVLRKFWQDVVSQEK